MAYIAVRFQATAEDAERWADALLECGALSVDAADPHAGTALETARYGERDDRVRLWPVSRLSALFSESTDVESVLIRAGDLLGVGTPAHSVEAIADADWVRQTQAQFRPLRVGRMFWIVPSWCEPVDPRAINLRLDPGLAFGTGDHPTTRLCLKWLTTHLHRGDSLLDYGCGSGILAIAAAKLGAIDVVGVDIDPQSVEASRANAERNEVLVRFEDPGALQTGAFNVVVANILANPLKLLAPLLASRVRMGGSIVLSGILEAQAAGVSDAYAQWFRIDVWNKEDGWVALAGTRRDKGT